VTRLWPYALEDWPPIPGTLGRSLVKEGVS
jgi:hypothetical protein